MAQTFGSPGGKEGWETDEEPPMRVEPGVVNALIQWQTMGSGGHEFKYQLHHFLGV